jgi:hypothetical protein
MLLRSLLTSRVSCAGLELRRGTSVFVCACVCVDKDVSEERGCRRVPTADSKRPQNLWWRQTT